MTQHTPGPWETRAFRGKTEKIISTDNNDWCICTMPNWLGDFEERESNARLIAAAPELLEALLTALPYVARAQCENCGGEGFVIEVEPTCCGNFTDQGECRGHCPVPEQVQVQCGMCDPDIQRDVKKIREAIEKAGG